MNTPADADATVGSLGERGIISLVARWFPSPPALLVGIGDDAAVAAPARGELQVLTTDAMVEGVHFDLAFCPLQDVGYKAVAVNVSDVAAMGGTSRLALLSLVLPGRLTVRQLERLLDGVERAAQDAGLVLAGGNITQSPGPLILDVSIVGSVRPRKLLRRDGGRPGDALYVTGPVGAAAAGLGWLREHPTLDRPDDPDMARCVERYRRPEPRARLGSILGRTRAATACMDTSDGLADAVRQVAGASGTGARIGASLLPIPEVVRQWFRARGQDPVLAAVAGGDDYELLFSVPARRNGRLRHARRHARGVPITRIGELTASPGIVLMTERGPEPLPEGFQHF